MALFESTLILLLIAVLLLQFSRRLSVPYPTILCLSGVGVAALPWAPDIPAPDITLDPQLALALFVAPVLVDMAYVVRTRLFPARTPATGGGVREGRVGRALNMEGS